MDGYLERRQAGMPAARGSSGRLNRDSRFGINLLEGGVPGNPTLILVVVAVAVVVAAVVAFE
jgi:hypothetical protein